MFFKRVALIRRYFHKFNTSLTDIDKPGTTMNRHAFKMKLLPGFPAEYKRRHDEIWPELAALLKEAGISEYSIFIDEDTNSLFGMLKANDLQSLDALSLNPLMQKWWAYMADIMETNPDNSPVSVPLTEGFYLIRTIISCISHAGYKFRQR